MPREAPNPGPIRTAAQLHGAYVGAFDLYAAEPSEAALHLAYELGRRAVELKVTVPDIARMHHAALAVALDASATAPGIVVQRASDFLAELLSAFEMVRRGYTEAQDVIVEERRHTRLLRHLWSLLGDTSLALDRARSLAETVKLVAEAACDLTGARYCAVELEPSETGDEPRTVVSGTVDASSEAATISAEIKDLAGRPIGRVMAVAENGAVFSSEHEALLEQLAQMAGAAVERARLYA